MKDRRRRIGLLGWAILSAGCSAVDVDHGFVPYDLLNREQAAKIDDVLSDVAVQASIGEARVRSGLEIYDFLLNEMPFTGSVVRVLGRGRWEVSREEGNPDPNVFVVVEPDKFRLRFELVWKEETRRFYISQGTFSMGILPEVEGRMLIVMRTIHKGESVLTDAVVYLKVDSSIYSALSKALRGMLETKMRDKCAYFIQAARWVAEEATQRPAELYARVKDAEGVDQAVLEEFRKRFLGCTMEQAH